MCLNGVCTSSPSAPKDTCPFGDDLLQQYHVQSFGIKLPFKYSTCEQAFELFQQKNASVSKFCDTTYLSPMCCQSCKSDKS